MSNVTNAPPVCAARVWKSAALGSLKNSSLSAYQMKMRSSTWMMFPLFWPQLTIFVGFVLLTLVLFVDIGRLWTKIRTGKTAEA